MHQQPPKTPLLRSTNAANASHVDSSSALTVYIASPMKPSSLTRWELGNGLLTCDHSVT